MTSKEVLDWINENGLTHLQAAQVLGVSRPTLYRQLSGGDVSQKVASAIISYSFVRARNDLSAAFMRFNDICDQMESIGGVK